ncbi:hypothetical protein Hypma_002811 [Hypsizygus marmoreus]|uniref:Uncharacterized protein n=1 Tax=Hypsizygus marmoreus TaxID=39966 RepID=A0A369J356_HYPMA|nr:hypothetical protein Hypma_002811 [Hypsizygus marmoreus]
MIEHKNQKPSWYNTTPVARYYSKSLVHLRLRTIIPLSPRARTALEDGLNTAQMGCLVCMPDQYETGDTVGDQKEMASAATLDSPSSDRLLSSPANPCLGLNTPVSLRVQLKFNSNIGPPSFS